MKQKEIEERLNNLERGPDGLKFKSMLELVEKQQSQFKKTEEDKIFLEEFKNKVMREFENLNKNSSHKNSGKQRFNSQRCWKLLEDINYLLKL